MLLLVELLLAEELRAGEKARSEQQHQHAAGQLKGMNHLSHLCMQRAAASHRWLHNGGWGRWFRLPGKTGNVRVSRFRSRARPGRPGRAQPCTTDFSIMQWIPFDPLTVWVTRRSAARLHSV